MSLTPDLSRKSGFSLPPSPAPFLTPRPERRRIESYANRLDRDKETNVQVLLRCRPLSEEEQKSNVPRVISCNDQKSEVTVLQSLANRQVDKVFTFDRVFGPKAQQRSIYDQAIAPIVHEVLDGFSCTVFAYGQTGTGKTYTMEGGMRKKGGDLPADAGVIPRAVRHIFDTLEAQNADYSMKVTFIELYNEEVTDLLGSDDNARSSEDRQKKPISLMEDGKGSVVIRGLEEEVVYSANDIYTLLERGAGKRRTADTLLNKRSSRSHSVFTITVHIKEDAVGDEELIKCGKLNLVDLAGSENICRSGAREGRAREAGEINKSLLTLGRVINALVEHSPHVPYRDSKLTRLLRDSLGGKTKTCIIATISPSAHSLDETLSTLDYAHRAKNIKNKPEANQKVSKAVLLKDLYLEIEKMREDVRAARDRNGVYLSNERHAQEEADKKARIEKIEQLENDLNICEKEVSKFRSLYITEEEQRLDVESELKECKMNIEVTNKALLDLQQNHTRALSALKEKDLVISKMKCSENSLIFRTKELCSDLQHASDDITSLFGRLDQKDKMESENKSMLLKFGSQLDQNLKDLHRTVLGSISLQRQQVRLMEEHASTVLASKSDVTRVMESRIKKTTDTYSSGVTALKELMKTLQKKESSDLEQISSIVSSQIEAIEQSLGEAAFQAGEVVKDIHTSLNEQKELLAFAAKQQEEGLHRSMISAQEISNAAAYFFRDIYNQAQSVMANVEESHNKRSQQLAAFEKTFTQEAEREEKQALGEIAAILSKLTSKKTAAVSEAVCNIRDDGIQENKRLQQQMSGIQQVSDNAKNEVCNYMKDVESNFMEDTVSAAESRAFMENFLHECSERVDHSRQLWENAESCIMNLNAENAQQLQTTLHDKMSLNQMVHDEITSTFSSMDAEFSARTDDILVAVKDSREQDQENRKASDSITELCSNQLQTLQENHGESISNIRSRAEQSLVKDYLVDQNMNATPKKRVIAVPSSTSIDEMKTPSFENHKEENILQEKVSGKLGHELSHAAASPPDRTPFLEVN